MVGRERELASLLDGLEDASSGRGRLFLISGEPGVGKTRLANEVAVVAEVKRMALLVGHCSEHDEAVAYLPFVEILENFIDRATTLEVLRTALGDQGPELARLLPKLKNILPELPPPLDLPPAQARRHLFNSFCDFAARIASEQPTLMILEDLHWADDSTLSLLDHLMQRLSDAPLMVIGTFRDANLNATRGLARTLEDSLRGQLATRVGLKGLPRDEVAAMLKSLSGKSPPASVVSEIHTETEGNPFFVEELFRHLEEENQLYDSSGQFRSEFKIGELEAPPSVQLVVARRLARLSDPTQKILATAATIGRFFSLELLEASNAAGADSLLESIDEAEKAGLVFSVAKSPRARFQFSHELIRQAVIGGLSAARRQKLHLEVADAIERTYSVASEDYCGELAHHYRLGGNLAKAIDYLVRAAQQAIQRSASTEAIEQLTSALRTLKSLPETPQRDQKELFLQTMLGPVLIATKGNAAPEVGVVYKRAVELGRKTGDNAQLFPVVFGLRSFHLVRAELRQARELGEQLLGLSETIQDAGLSLEANLAQGNISFLFGELIPALKSMERAFALYDPQKYHAHAFLYGLDPGVFCLARIAWIFALVGYLDRAAEKMSEMLALARRQSHAYSLAVATVHACVILNLRGDWSALQQQAEAGIALCNEQGFENILQQSKQHRGYALVQQGQTEKGIALMREGLAASRATGAALFHPYYLARLAQACGIAARFEEGLTTLAEAIAIVERTEEHLYEAKLYQLKGELTLKQFSIKSLQSSVQQRAEACFRKSIEIAQRQEAKTLELSAAMSLSRLWRRQNKKAEARQMLAEIYGWFTEGFDTADLKDANVLLEELNT